MSSYELYKARTNVFIAWVGETTRAFGWRASSERDAEAKLQANNKQQTSKRLKGKARKEARRAQPVAAEETRKYLITTVELQDQINLLGSKSVRMPRDIALALGDCIAARDRYAKWFEKSNTGTSQEREGHWFFLQLLKQASRKLSVSKDVKTGSGKPGDKPDVSSARNTFDALPVEYTSESFKKASSKAHPLPSPKVKYEVDLRPAAEWAFVIFSMFEDINRIRTYLRGVWTRFHSGELTQVIATIITTAAIDMVGLAEEGYKDIAGAIYAMDAIDIGKRDFLAATETRGSNRTEIEGGPHSKPLSDKPAINDRFGVSDLDDFMLSTMAKSLYNLAQLGDKAVGEELVLPQWMLRHYEEQPELLKNERVKQALVQDRFICELWIQMVFEERYRHIDEYPDLAVFQRAGLFRGAACVAFPYSDICTMVMRPLWTTGKVTLQTVFAAQVLWDVYQTSTSSKAQEHTRAAFVDRLKSSFRFSYPPSPDPSVIPPLHLIASSDTSLHWHTDEEFKINARLFCCQNDLETPFALGLNQALLRSEKRKEPESRTPVSPEENRANLFRVLPNPDVKFAFSANPLHLGTKLLEAVVLAEAAGLCAANNSLSVFAVAHLYHAFRQIGILERDWPEMDRVIELHKKTIFAGVLPKTPHEMAKRIGYRLGMDTNPRRYSEKRPAHLRPNMASCAIREHLMSMYHKPNSVGTQHWTRLVTILLQLADQHEHELRGSGLRDSDSTNDVDADDDVDADGTMDDLKPLKEKFKHLTLKKSAPTDADLIKLEKYLKIALEPMNMDWADLRKRCNDYLKRIHDTLTATNDLLHLGDEELAAGNVNLSHYVTFFIIDAATACDSENIKKAKKAKKETTVKALVEEHAERVILARNLMLTHLLN
ncbi:hypothetical protein F4778DRAFT_798655 [Xylariomycetidae sp. FL2044]|nr:hypothetical protein F4778DRAFT_798655 [Xylariomycetidae sp. FL2044]